MAAIVTTSMFGAPCFQLRKSELHSTSYSSTIATRFFGSRRSVDITHKVGNAAILPKIKAKSENHAAVPEYDQDCKFYNVVAIIRPWRCPKVTSALLKMGIQGVTISDVKGFGAQGGSKERQGGTEFSLGSFVPKVKMEIVVRKNQVEAVIDKIVQEGRTGEIGDGKIFLTPVLDVIRVRTGERGEQAERMAGGRTDMNSAA